MACDEAGWRCSRSAGCACEEIEPHSMGLDAPCRFVGEDDGRIDEQIILLAETAEVEEHAPRETPLSSGLIFDMKEEEDVFCLELEFHDEIDFMAFSLSDVGKDLLVERNDLGVPVDIRRKFRQKEIDEL